MRSNAPLLKPRTRRLAPVKAFGNVLTSIAKDEFSQNIISPKIRIKLAPPGSLHKLAANPENSICWETHRTAQA